MSYFERGRAVLIDFMITNAEGSWCEVREPGQAKRAGYALCGQLSSEAVPSSSPEMVSISKAALNPEGESVPSQRVNSEGAGASVANASAPTGSNVLGAWSVQLGLTEEQNAKIVQLLKASGLISCRDDLAAAYRSFGVTDASSMLNRTAKWGKNPYGDSFARVTEPKIKRGGKSYKIFWQGVWNTLTHEQHEKAATMPGFLFGYLGSQSDPELGFSSYVLRYIRVTTPRPK